METKFLTPIQLWKDFNPVKEPLEISYVSSNVNEDGFVRRGVYYTSESASDGRARIYAEIVAIDDNKKKPILLVIGDLDNNIDSKLLEYVANCGYIAASLDYSAISKDRTVYSKYPESLKFAQYDNAIDNLNRAEPSARETCWFVWAKAARRLISVLALESSADMNNIGVIGVRHGALIMWHLAAMDGRVKAAASVVGNEGMLYKGKFKFDNGNDIELDDSRVNWRAAISSEAYARFVSCPILIATSTNNSVSSFDRMEDIVSLLPENSDYTFIACPRLSNQISESVISTIRKWFNSKMKKAAFPANPKMSYEVNDNKMNIIVEPDDSKKIKSVHLHYSYGEPDPEYRNWHTMELTKKDSYSTTLDIYDIDIRHYVYANIIYSDSLTISALEQTFIPAELEIQSESAVRQRIIYDAGKGIDTFTVASDALVVDDDNPYISKSEMGINGITTSEGTLITYKVGDIRCYGEEDSILQLDASSKESRSIELALTCLEDGDLIVYTATAEVSGEEDWTKISFEAQDFKSKDLISMKDWDGLKKLEIKNANNILFNNIIWV